MLHGEKVLSDDLINFLKIDMDFAVAFSDTDRLIKEWNSTVYKLLLGGLKSQPITESTTEGSAKMEYTLTKINYVGYYITHTVCYVAFSIKMTRPNAVRLWRYPTIS